MKSARLAVHALATILAVGLALASPASLRAQTVKIEVSPGTVTADRPPGLYAYGGNIWWIPSIFGAAVAPRILAMENMGMTRISLGDQILTHATSLEDLQRRLDTYPLNDFLRQYAKAGGKVLFILDGVPIWASSNKSTKTFPDPDQKIFRMSPPADFEEWSKVVETIVRHFNGKLGLNAYYESWNEPNWYYLGTTEQYHKQYYHSVLGARRADPRALVGGPGISEFIGTGTRGDGQAPEAEKRAQLQRFVEQQYAFKQFLDYAGRTPVPELGLSRVPVDFFSWHSFYIDPTVYYRVVVPVIRSALTAAGYPATTPLINTEWNIAAVPPYPEGPLNATEVGAAFVASSLIAMHRSGVDAQIFQMYTDPGVDGYFGGTLTQTGIPRANFNTFRLFSLLKGREVQSRTGDPWVGSTAFADGRNIYVLVSVLVPTQKMLTETGRIQSALQNADFVKSLAAAQLLGKKSLPEPFAGKAREIGERNQKALQGASAKAAAWKNGITLELELPGIRGGSDIRHYLIDSRHSNIYPDLPKAERFLAERHRRTQQDLSDTLVTRLQEAGLSRQAAERVAADARARKPGTDLLSAVPADKRDAAAKVLVRTSQEARGQFGDMLREIENWPSARLHEDTVKWPASGNLRIASEPYAVHLFVIPQ